MLPSDKRIGIIGGGQLGKMLIEASRPWNIKYTVLESDEQCPASMVADSIIKGSLYDAEKIRQLASETDVITFEIEHINSDILLELEAGGKKIIPSPRILKIIQDKGLQKEFFSQKNIPTAPYVLADTGVNTEEAISGFTGEKVVIKSRTGGYDGKGVQIVDKENLRNGTFVICEPVVIEQFYDNITEYAVIVAMDSSGNKTTFPLIEMYFNPVSNLVEFLFSPANIDPVHEENCRQIASSAIAGFGGAGLFAVELFLTADGQVLLNEIAPRPHNSGHHTIEGCYTSQFEQLNRILLDLPLGNTGLIQPSAMINLVAPDGLNGKYQLKNAEKLLEMAGVYVHLYNKKDIKPNRKMGHITVMAENVSDLMDKAALVKELAGFE